MTHFLRSAAAAACLFTLVAPSAQAAPEVSVPSRVSYGPELVLRQVAKPKSPTGAVRFQLPDMEREAHAKRTADMVHEQVGFSRSADVQRMAPFTQHRLAWESGEVGAQSSRVEVLSGDAAGMRVGLRIEAMPPDLVIRTLRDDGATWTIVDETRSTDLTALHGGRLPIEFWTVSTDGQSQWIEFETHHPSALEVRLFDVSHRPPAALAKVTNPCHVDAICSGNPHANERMNAVGRIRYVKAGDTYSCSGSLLNDRPAVNTLFFATASHCVSSQAVASTLEHNFHYHQPTCGGAVPADQWVGGGASMMAVVYDVDFSLLRLERRPPGNLLFLGWGAGLPTRGTGVVGMHHPRGEYMRYSAGRVTGGVSVSGYGGPLIEVLWDTGMTEKGSSGSPLWETQNYTFRGVLSGAYGDASCSYRNALYGSFYGAYEAMAPFLDGVVGAPGVPGAPVLTAATSAAASSRIVVSFAPPSSSGGAAVTKYVATCGTYSVSGDASPLWVSYIPQGTYTCVVAASNSVGQGPNSAPSSPVSVGAGSPPWAPGIPTVTAGVDYITVSFSPAISGGSAPLDEYVAECASSTGNTVSETGRGAPITINQVSPGTYTCTAKAINRLGLSTTSGRSAPVTVVDAAGSTTLSISVVGLSEAGGVVDTSSPLPRLFCQPGETCRGAYPRGTMVSISANAATGSQLASFTGECAGDLAGRIKMDRNRTCTATFIPNPGASSKLANGDFEAGDSGWTIANAEITNARPVCSGTGTCLTNNARRGSFYARFNKPDVAQQTRITRRVTIGSGVITHLRFWTKVIAGTTPGSLNVYVQRVGGPIEGIYSLDGQSTLAGYRESAPFDLTRYAGQAIDLHFYANISSIAAGGRTTEILIDDVELLETAATSATANYSGLWWNQAEPGWGINFAQQGSTMFAAIFTYDLAGRPTWYVMSEGRQSGQAFVGGLYRVSASPFSTEPFPPIASSNVTRVGELTVNFSSATAGTLSYGVDGRSVTKQITPQVFNNRYRGRCQVPGSMMNTTSNLTGLWWNQNEPGWGVNISQQEETLFATVFTYGADSQPAWFVMSEGRRQNTIRTSYSGTLYQVSAGSPFNAQPYRELAPGAIVPVGTLSLFSGGTDEFTIDPTLTLEYTVNGTRVQKRIHRQLFDGLPPICGS